MEAFFSKEIQAGLDLARVEGLKKSSRFRINVKGQFFPVLRIWKTGFAMADDAPALRGLVDIFEGSAHLVQCLIVASDEVPGERRYEFKRATIVSDGPAVDFEIDENAPVGLIGQEQDLPIADR